MIKNEYFVIGVMSGTSLDGIDLVYARFYFDTSWRFDVLKAETNSYTSSWLNRLTSLVSYSLEELKDIDEEYTIYLANQIKDFIIFNSITKIDVVCSHGHTALHQPDKQLTYQIGNLSSIATLLNITVVCDFRIQDVKLGGQGAPLVPIGDKMLFSEYDFCLNLGGFANISTDINGERIAYDICPVNIVLNRYAKLLGVDYDDKGIIAASGKICKPLLRKLNNLEFYKQVYPKSLGLEWVEYDVIPLITSFKISFQDVLRTFCEHVAIQISKEIETDKKSSVLITGGGVYNEFLISRMKYYSKQELVIPSNIIIEFKEALIFGFLGVLKLRDEPNCLSSVTGAKKDHSSGVIYQ